MTATNLSRLSENLSLINRLPKSTQVDGKIVFAHNIIISAFLDLKKSTNESARLVSISLMYVGIGMLGEYLRFPFDAGQPSPRDSINLNYYLNIYEIEHRLSDVIALQNAYLLGNKEYDTNTIIDLLVEILGFLRNIVLLLKAIPSEIVSGIEDLIENEIMNLPTNLPTAEVLAVRKKFVIMENPDVQQMKQELKTIRPFLAKKKSNWSINILKNLAGKTDSEGNENILRRRFVKTKRKKST